MKNTGFSLAGKREPGLVRMRFPGDFLPPGGLAPDRCDLPDAADLAVFFVPRLLALPRWELQGGL